MDLNNKTVIISRTDSIGDVMLSFPMCAWLKKEFPKVRVIFLGKGYTQPLINAYNKIDRFENWDDYSNNSKLQKVQKLKELNADVIIHVFPNKEIASVSKMAKIPMRVGTSHRSFHLLTCTHRLNFTRKRATLHESQLNHELLKPFGLFELPTLKEIEETTKFFKVPIIELPEEFKSLENITILHPKSQGSAKEWPIEKYIELTEKLIKRGEQVVFSGTESEGDLFRSLLPKSDLVYDTTGKLSLDQLIVLISKAKNFVACSTGPLHIAGFVGVNTVGLFSPKRPIHKERWGAIGKNVHSIVFDENCPTCKKGKNCNCIELVEVQKVLENLM